jgi:hypothetical protein
MGERMQEKRYWKVSGTYKTGVGNAIYKVSMIISAETEADAEKRAMATKSFTTITEIKETDALTYIAAKVTALEKKTEHIGDIYGLVICLIIFIVIINIIGLFVKV